jgi:hypothetical protein
MGSIIGVLVGRTIFGKVIDEKLARLIAYAGLIAVLLAMLGTAICSIRKDAVDDHEAKIEARAKPATDKAADERARDTIATAQHEQELHNAIAAQPDQPIAPTSRALACKRLRDAGRHPPACS